MFVRVVQAQLCIHLTVGIFMATAGAVFPTAESLEADLKADPEGMLDMDFIYFDAEKDHVESAKMISGQSLDGFWRQFPV
jgi:hypothetical protein